MRCAAARATLLGGLAAAGVLLGAPGSVGAQPTRWEIARAEPPRQLELLALDRAERELAQGRRLRRVASRVDPLVAGALLVHQQEARRQLEGAGAETSESPLLRYRLAEVLVQLGDHARAADLLAGAAPHLSPSLQGDAYTELALCYARLGRSAEETAAYERALSAEPHSPTRATLLANQAEGFMARGQLDRAIAGYRASLGQLDTAETAFLAPTTLWGLGVALDRAGDLDGALDAVGRARAYDPTDQRLSSPSWFYVPPYDEAWYAALGHLFVARRARDAASRTAAYGRALERMREYVDRAPSADLWVPLATLRIRQIEREITGGPPPRRAPGR